MEIMPECFCSSLSTAQWHPALVHGSESACSDGLLVALLRAALIAEPTAATRLLSVPHDLGLLVFAGDVFSLCCRERCAAFLLAAALGCLGAAGVSRQGVFLAAYFQAGPFFTGPPASGGAAHRLLPKAYHQVA